MVRELIENDRIVGGTTEACAEHAEAVYRTHRLKAIGRSS
jgi:UDP-N-acetyl-D-mannosaminuronate dehydrogenase